MKTNKYILCGIIGMMMTACGSEEMTLQTQNDNIVKLTAKIEGMVATRAAASDYQMNTQFVSGRPLNVYIVDHDSQEGISGTTNTNGGDGYIRYTTGESGSMTTTTAPTYPANNKIDIYALHGISMDLTSAPLTSGSNYVNDNDVMYAVAINVDNEGGKPIELTFKHVCSKITVTLDKGTTNKDLTGAKIKGNFNNGIYTEHDRTTGLTANIYDNTGKYFETFDFGTYNAGGNVHIIGPQKRYPDSTKPMFSVETSDGMVYNYFPSEEVTFESGKAYTFNLKLSEKYLLDVSSTVSPWDSTPTVINGDAKQ